MGKKEQYTVGLLVSGIMDEVTKNVCKGVFQEAKQLDINVVVLPGKYPERDLSDNRELMYEYQYNTVFSYARRENIDALIINLGSIGCFASSKSMEAMLKQYKEIPCVLLSAKMDGYVSVNFDNYQGIRDGLEYLIEQVGCKKFGMIGGSLDNTDALERKNTFVETLLVHGIKFEEKMYVEGDFSRRSTEAYRKLLDDNPELEAVFCVNDEVAMGLYEELRHRGIQPGKDIYVLGYDDTVMSAKMTPSLSSVRADAGRLGEEAVRMVTRMLNGEKVADTMIPTRFIRRDSIPAGSGEVEMNQKKGGEITFEDIFFRLCHEEMQEKMEKLRASYCKMLETLYINCEQNMNGFDGALDIMHYVDEFLNLGGMEYADVDILMNHMEEVYRKLLAGKDDKSKFELRDIFTIIYKKMIRAMNSQFGNIQEHKDSENYAMKLFVQDMLQFERGRDQSYKTLLENLDWLQVKNAAIYMLPKPVLHLDRENFQRPEELYLKAVLKQGKVSTVPANKQKRKISEIYSNSLTGTKQRWNKVLLPLFFKEMVYGILICDMTEKIYDNGEFLVNQISSAIKMITLLQANEKIQQQLEDNLAALKAHNIELDTISKRDVLTGILNRRGFYSEAEKEVAKNRKKNMDTLVIYVDMNNLKIINDRYGHEEGDYSLKLIGSFLKEMVEESGIAGRIGGDEYACAMAYDGNDEGKETLEILNKKFTDFNRKSPKPYNITVSAGACIIGTEEALTLKEALLQADTRLYEVKQHRKKDVVKQTTQADFS